MECLVQPGELPALLQQPNTTILSAHVQQVKQYNTDILHAKFNQPSILPLPIRSSAHSDPELAE